MSDGYLTHTQKSSDFTKSSWQYQELVAPEVNAFTPEHIRKLTRIATITSGRRTGGFRNIKPGIRKSPADRQPWTQTELPSSGCSDGTKLSFEVNLSSSPLPKVCLTSGSYGGIISQLPDVTGAFWYLVL